MEKIGIICEYNPFHNGHIYHINKIKEMYPDSIIILIVNGYFLQRGEISLLSKEDKTKLALHNNVDIVLELPVIFGTQSADTFAYKSIEILNHLNVNRIIFGSECNDINKLEQLANISLDVQHNPQIKELLDEGINYPTALTRILNIKERINPNDLLAISYIKAIKQINTSIIPEVIQRTNDYLDTTSCDEIISASNIRSKLKNNEEITKYVPNETINYLKTYDKDLFFSLLKHTILTNGKLKDILDVEEGFEYLLKKSIIETNSYDELILKVKNKRYTYNKLNRMFIHILLGIMKYDAQIDVSYIKILGFNLKGKEYLNTLRKDLKELVINKKSKIYNLEITASLIYDMLTNSNTYTFEKKNKPIID